MKKFYAFLAAALISVCAFATPEQVPSDAVLLDYYTPGQVCACIYVPVEIACNPIVFVGTYNNWAKGSGTVEDAANCTQFEAIEGYDGWYVVAVDDETESPEGKPVMLDASGAFNWQYQIGAATVIRGGVSVVAGLPGEIDLKTYGKDAPNVYTVDAWKNNPCTAVVHNYKITVISAGCDGFAVPFIAGSMNSWSFAQFQIDVAQTQALQAPVYYYTFKGAEGTDEYQLASGLMDATGTITDPAGWNDNAYMQELTEDGWARINGGANFVAGEETEIVFDLRQENLRWARCDDSPELTILVTMTSPAGAPAAGVEIIGFAGWSDDDAILMAANNNVYTATITAKESAEFKFREAGTWDNEIEKYNAESDEWGAMPNVKISTVLNEAKDAIVLDLSDPEMYRWKVVGDGIENVVLTEKAQKVVVDGVLYIIRDNKMFNVQGTQVR